MVTCKRILSVGIRIQQRRCFSSNVTNELEKINHWISNGFHNQAKEYVLDNDFRFSLYSYSIRKFAEHGMGSIADELISKMRENKCDPDKYLISYLVSQSITHGNMQLAMKYLTMYDTLIEDNDPHPYTSVLVNLAKNGLLDEAENLWDVMMSKGIRLDNLIYTPMIQVYFKHKQYSKAFTLLDEMMHRNIIPDGNSFFIWFNIVTEFDDYSNTQKLWNLMREIGVEFNTTFYNRLLKVYCASKVVFLNRLNTIYNEMNENNIPFDNLTYQYFIKCYSRGGKQSKVEFLRNRMITEGVELTTSTFVDLVNMYCKNGNIDKAEELVDNIDNYLLPSNRDILIGYTSLLHATAKKGDITKLYQLLSKMESRKIGLDDVCVTSIVTGLIYAKNIDEAAQLYSKWRHLLSDKYHTIIYSQLAKSYAKLGSISEALESVEMLNRLSLPVSVGVYIDLFEMLFLNNQKEQANSIATLLYDYKPTLKECINIIDIFISLECHKYSRDWIDYMVEEDMAPSKWYKENSKGQICSKNPNRKRGSLK